MFMTLQQIWDECNGDEYEFFNVATIDYNYTMEQCVAFMEN